MSKHPNIDVEWGWYEKGRYLFDSEGGYKNWNMSIRTVHTVFTQYAKYPQAALRFRTHGSDEPWIYVHKL